MYLKIYGTDLPEICMVGRTMAVDDQSEIDFSNSRVKKLGRGNQFYQLYPQN